MYIELATSILVDLSDVSVQAFLSQVTLYYVVVFSPHNQVNFTVPTALPGNYDVIDDVLAVD